MKFDFEIISHAKQRYDTCGDYFRKGKEIAFRVSRMEDRRYCWLVFLHEIIEWTICKLTGVKVGDIDRFDKKYERFRAERWSIAPCGCKLQDEPGEDIHAPYWRAHQVATKCERLIAEVLDVDWIDYEEAVYSLSDK